MKKDYYIFLIFIVLCTTGCTAQANSPSPTTNSESALVVEKQMLDSEITPSVSATAKLDSKATETVTVTLSPTPTETIQPTVEPTATEAIKQSVEPTATETIKPTLAPKPKETTKPTLAPKPKETTKPTLAPKPKETTKPTLAPKPKETKEPTTSVEQKQATETVSEKPKAESPTIETSKKYIGSSKASLVKALGQPNSSSYAPSCIGEGEDGELNYNGFVVYTYKESEVETVTSVEPR